MDQRPNTAPHFDYSADKRCALGRLRQAIIDNTKGDDLFWIGEILLSELAKETGFKD